MKILVILFAIVLLAAMISLSAASNGNEFARVAANYLVPSAIALGFALFIGRLVTNIGKSNSDATKSNGD